ncbi:divergent PAP2 family protein [Paenibacillus sp. BR2-3]|uniref:divergent PAP2 family protein n=1 Tax=Paenibacillus sp. BR2-3 TaxID=3048494 RepID=UPI0039772FCA
MSVFYNFPLNAALLSIVLAQLIKVPIYLITKQTWNLKLGFSTGGMPSSHSAAVCSLAAAIGIEEGLSSASFAIAVIVSAITMYDAAGIRRHAGIHASLINQLMSAFPGTKGTPPKKALKELLGHRPIEVVVGALFGILVSIVLNYVIY